MSSEPWSPPPGRSQPRYPQPRPGVPEPDAEPIEIVAAPQPWRIKPVLPVTKLLGAVAVVVLVTAFGRHDRVQWFLAAAVVAGLALWALRDLVAPVRLAADEDGVTVVVGYAGRRRVPWSQIETVRLDSRDRLGVRTRMLEIDADDNLYLFSLHDLGAQPDEVLPTLVRLRPGTSSDTPTGR